MSQPYKYFVDGNRVTIGFVRFTVLSSTCIRIERTDNGGKFEDRHTQVFSQRNSSFLLFKINGAEPLFFGKGGEGVDVRVESGDNVNGNVIEGRTNGASSGGEGGGRGVMFEDSKEPFTVGTDSLLLQFFYKDGVTSFTDSNLTVSVTTNPPVLWRYGQKGTANLLGTACTLDFQRIKGHPVLEQGLISRDGFTILDDSYSLVFEPSGWLSPRCDLVDPTRAKIDLKDHSIGEKRDFYFFGYGQNYQQCLKDFSDNSGPIPLIPKWALGLWWSKWYHYRQQEFIDLVDTFQEKKMPLSALCIDMDWHLVDVQKEPGAPSGWTGYTWNLKLIESPPKLLQDLHQRGVKVALNLHPAEGCYPHEEGYKAFAEHMGIDPKSKKLICFDIADPRFAEGYFKFLHHPHEAIGVDMWWIDWQQIDASTIKSLGPLWWLSHLHSYNRLDKNARPIVFSRWGGLGSHKYPCGFSGDTIAEWDHLQMLPYFTATAANVCYNWWSHDIGGFQWGTNDPDLYVRWFQFGALSPILRLHSTKNEFEEKLPWKYDKGTFELLREALRLRESLLSYIYSISWKMYSSRNMSFLFPTYYLFPESEHAYHCPNQYFFGSELLVVPFLHKIDPEIRLSRTVAWFPPGSWFSFESGQEYIGDVFETIYGKIDEIPIFAPPGAIVPLVLQELPTKNRDRILNFPPAATADEFEKFDKFEIRVFAGADREFVLYDDEGANMDYTKGGFSVTTLRQIFRQEAPQGEKMKTHHMEFTIVQPTTSPSFQPRPRAYVLKIRGIFLPPSSVQLLVDNLPVPNASFTYLRSSHEIVFQPIYSDLSCDITVRVEQIAETFAQAKLRRSEQRTQRFTEAMVSFATFAPVKDSVHHSSTENGPGDWIFNQGFNVKTSMHKAHVEMMLGCGSALFETPEITYLVLWNYLNKEQVTYEMQSNFANYKCETTIIPPVKVLEFDKEFTTKKSCTTTVMLGVWKDTYTVGRVPSADNTKPEKRSILGHLRKMF